MGRTTVFAFPRYRFVTMRTLFARIGLLLIATLVAVGTFTQTTVVRANESASYKLYDTYPNDAEGGPRTSTSFLMNEANMTWHQQPLIGSNFQILPAPVDTSSSSTSGGGTSSTSSNGGGDHGGCRGHTCDSSSSSTASSTTSQSSTSAQSSSTSTPSTSSAASTSTSTTSLEAENKRLKKLHEDAPETNTTALSQAERLVLFHSVESIYHAAPAVIISSMTQNFWFAPFLTTAALSLLELVVIGFLLATRVPKAPLTLLPFFLWFTSTKKTEKKKTTASKRKAAKTLLSIALLITSGALALGLGTPHAFAETTAPTRQVYNGHLLGSTGAPITTAHTVRFSYWYSADYLTGDNTGTGAVNTGATNYGRWKEAHTVTPDAKGYFSVQLGSVNARADGSTDTPAQLQSLFLQVEVKPDGTPDSSYELLDVNGSSTTVDRSPILSVPFAQNADMIDRHDVGTGSGSIPLLQSGGLLPVSAVPGGTNVDFFTIDSNNSAPGNITLKFGNTLNKTLSYSQTNARFEFNDSVNIQGNLTVSGTINGVDITNITGTDQKLRASSGVGLNLNVSAGGYRINGASTDYAGGNTTLANNTTSYVFLGSGGLKAYTSNFPTDESYIPVAQVTTAAGAITAINDKRIVSSDDREVAIKKAIQPGFSDATYQADASDNVGTLESTFDTINSKNFYKWTSTRPTLQDYDVILQVPLSAKFIRWKTGSLKINYRTTSSDANNNKLDISVFDTNGTPVSLTGTATGLVSTAWTSTTLDFAGSPTWTAGQTMVIKIKVYAKDAFQAHVGAVEMNYDDLISP